MGVYIKEFDVPKDCAECDDDGLRGLVGCQFFLFGIGRHPFCPLIEVPEPHGRLIDADALFKIIKWHHDLYEESENASDKARRDENLQVMCDITDAPTVIEAEGE